MDFKRYLGKIKNKIEENKADVIEENKADMKQTLDFVDKNKDPYDYLKRYLKEPKYKDWFNRNYPDHTIYDAVGLSISDYLTIKRELFPESQTIEDEESNNNVRLKPALMNSLTNGF